jgi:hypothetical protein
MVKDFRQYAQERETPGKKPTARALKFAQVLAANSAGEKEAVGIERTGDSAVGAETRGAARAAHGAQGDAP